MLIFQYVRIFDNQVSKMYFLNHFLVLLNNIMSIISKEPKMVHTDPLDVNLIFSLSEYLIVYFCRVLDV